MNKKINSVFSWLSYDLFFPLNLVFRISNPELGLNIALLYVLQTLSLDKALLVNLQYCHKI